MKKALIISGIVGIVAMLTHYFTSLTLEQQYDSSWIDIYANPLGVIGTFGLVATFVCYIVWPSSTKQKELFGVVTVVNVFFILMLIGMIADMAQQREHAKTSSGFLGRAIGFLLSGSNTKPTPPLWLVYTEFISGYITIASGFLCYVLTSILYSNMIKEEKAKGA
jgi:drug/metabolite transporter (DMT)-like permease